VGDVGPGSGKVFYVAPTRQTWGTYLEAAPTDYKVSTAAHTPVQWGCYMELKNITATAIGTGKANTAEILDLCNEPSIAARVAANYRGGGKSDWFLPSKDELNLMHTNKDEIGGFAADGYWSSSENNAYYAWYQDFTDGSQGNGGKYGTNDVRPVRAF